MNAHRPSENRLAPERCPKYEGCNAPVCPLWVDWRRLSHLRGEPVCLWLRERSKAGGEARLRERLEGDMAEAVSVAYLELSSAGAQHALGHGEIRRVLRDSAKSGSKLASAERLRRPREAHHG